MYLGSLLLFCHTARLQIHLYLCLICFQDLITYTVFHQPEKPFPFMKEVVENYYGVLNEKDNRED